MVGEFARVSNTRPELDRSGAASTGARHLASSTLRGVCVCMCVYAYVCVPYPAIAHHVPGSARLEHRHVVISTVGFLYFFFFFFSYLPLRLQVGAS
ncbi:uncharacterized protein LY79DRAFT_164556 [Colletotrichum navitas]|uniref:Uncharacterized protein n=1 Tax=Colletotrichum navitas TaxID=681940 RepID=A0AAD8Q1S9_9PEZI|nr:uncharacterized protein LY79DRAFT_164556 [Colletotrichum navitas]KAK1593934.1 hypothetical protein LY79DRAFT_164556 [Colletotrichum navitas]